MLVSTSVLHREVLEDPLLDPPQPEVVGVEHLAPPARTSTAPSLRLRPRQGDDPVEVVAHHRRLGRHHVHLAQLAELLLGPRLHLHREVLGRERLRELLEVGPALLVAELLLDRLHLLVEPVLALVRLALPLDPRLELLLDLQELDLGEQRAVDPLEPRRHRHRLEQLLALLELELQRRHQHVREAVRVLERVDREQHLGRDGAVELDEPLEGGLDRADQGLDLHVRLRLGGGLLELSSGQMWMPPQSRDWPAWSAAS
jgi:hypothetical protein